MQNSARYYCTRPIVDRAGKYADNGHAKRRYGAIGGIKRKKNMSASDMAVCRYFFVVALFLVFVNNIVASPLH
jgi:hypothetical protein